MRSFDMKYFIVEESPYFPNNFVVNFTDEGYSVFKKAYPCWHLYKARILGFTFAEYLKYTASNYDAIIRGKNTTYPTIYFLNKQSANQSAQELDDRLKAIIKNYGANIIRK